MQSHPGVLAHDSPAWPRAAFTDLQGALDTRGISGLVAARASMHLPGHRQWK